ncbi:MAG: hypothetical protein QOG69_894 [Actinomycetota bacterium]|nr:hypothetical protein [Actinomycetota bacterium]
MSRLGIGSAAALALCAALVISGCKATAKPQATSTALPSDVVPAASSQPAVAPSSEAATTDTASASPIDSPTPTSAPTSSSPSVVSSPSAASSTPSGADAAGRTPCPIAPPQVFVHVSHVGVAGGNVVLTYRTAVRLCGGEDDGAYETTGTVDKQARVDPAAKILMVPADVATSSAQQITAAELPSAMATPTFEYFGVTFDPSGSVVAMEQYFHP